MDEYFGIIEMERFPHFYLVSIYADSAESAKSAYENHCNKVGGYVYNLYPVHDGNRAKFENMVNNSSVPVPTIYA